MYDDCIIIKIIIIRIKEDRFFAYGHVGDDRYSNHFYMGVVGDDLPNNADNDNY